MRRTIVLMSLLGVVAGGGCSDPVTQIVPDLGKALQNNCCGFTCCFIAAVCRTSGTVNPANPCEECNPALAGTAWSPIAIDCTAFDGECQVGQCDPATGACAAFNETAGSICTPDGVDCTDDICDAGGTCTHPPATAGTTCTADALACTDDECDGAGVCIHPANTGKGCLIGGACEAEGASDPGNPCAACDSATDNTNWSPANLAGACGTQTCNVGVITPAPTCDAGGACVAGPVGDCGTYLICANAADCATSCATSADCTVDATCTGNVCVATRANGESCTAGNQCQSTFCRDGFCCDTTCDALCEACAAALTGGADGTCADVVTGQDPHNDCADAGAAACGLDGLCDGAGACSLYPAGTECLASSCSGDSVVAASTCDGGGTCLAGLSTDCAPFACASNACNTTCNFDIDCTTGNTCNAGSCGGGNGIPTAMITGPNTGVEGTEVTLSAADSTDPENQALTYAWLQNQGPDVEGSPDFTSSMLRFTLPLVDAATTLVFVLVVNDGIDDSPVASHSIVVTEDVTLPPDNGGGCACGTTTGSGALGLLLLLFGLLRRGRAAERGGSGCEGDRRPRPRPIL